MGSSGEARKPSTTIDGRQVIWDGETPYVVHEGSRINVSENGQLKQVAGISLAKHHSKEGLYYRQADIVERSAPSRRGRFVAGTALGLVIGVATTAAIGVYARDADSARVTQDIAGGDVKPKAGPGTETPVPTVGPEDDDDKKDSKSKPSPSRTAKPTPTAKSTTEVLPTTPEGCMEAMPLDVKIGQMTMWSVTKENMKSVASEFNKYHIGGAIIMNEPEDPKAAIAEFKKKQDIAISFGIDQEGGASDPKNKNAVQRFKSIGLLPSQQEMAATKTPAEAQKIMTEHYKKLKDTGVDVVFAPVADVGPNLGSRSFSATDAPKAAQYTNAYIIAAESVGLTPTLKHFPGLGKATGNTDFVKDVTTPPLDKLKLDWDPYEKAPKKNKVGAMLASSATPGLTEDGKFKMAMFSANTVNELRNNLGFVDSVLYTDALNAEQITSKMRISEAFVEATVAGVDVKLIAGTQDGASMGEQMSVNRQRIETAIKEKRLDKVFLDAQVLRVFGQKGLNACTVLKQVKKS